MSKFSSPFLVLVLCALASSQAFAYPISPVPLWPLTASAELIVVATVEDVHALPRQEGDWNTAHAQLRVRKTLKGRSQRRVGVRFPANMVCPAPPRYLKGETVVAFLARRDDTWQTVSLSYGTLYAKGEALEDMTTLVQAAVAIQSSKASAEQKQQQRLEWLVQAAVLPGTRWHGLYELLPSSDEIRSHYDRSGRSSIPIQPAQLPLLAKAFVEAPKFNKTMAMMLQVLAGHQDTAVDQLALATIESLLMLDQPPWWTQQLIWAVLERWGDEQPAKRLERLMGDSWESTPGQLRQVWSAAKGQLDIPDVEPLDIEPERYIPVGGQTPS